MAAENTIVKEAVQEAWTRIEKDDPEDFSKLNKDPKLKDAITQAATKAAEEEVTLAHEFASRPEQDIRKRLAKHLPEDRIKLVEEALSIPTFRMEITKMKSGKYLVQLKRGDEEFLPSRELATLADIEAAKILQYASIVVEAVLLVMQAAGIIISVSSSTMKATIQKIVEKLEKTSKFVQAIEEFVTSWNKAGNNAGKKAKAIFILIGDIFANELLWTIIKGLCNNMKWYDWLKTFATVCAMIAAAVATGGVALTAKIALIVLAAVDFARKFTNLAQLEEIKKSL